MDEVFYYILIPVILVVAVASAIYSYKKEKERRARMAALAAEHGLSFDPSKDSGRDEQFSQFSVFRKGHSRMAYNTISGSIDLAGESVPLHMGDYRYKVTSGSGKNRRTRTYRLSYLITALPYPNVPKFLVRPENLFDKFAGVIGFDDIDFESSEFSRKFHVSSKDKRFAYDLIDPRMMEFLMADRSVVLNMEAGFVCLLLGTRRWKVEDFGVRMEWLNTFFEHWPRHLVKSLQEDGYSDGGARS
ncbi:MAG: DUF3137 domain-containing protein [Phycisphaerales bacterium]|nr:DUF3137 domain-containing protein [Phycisphaerales bacterium]